MSEARWQSRRVGPVALVLVALVGVMACQSTATTPPAGSSTGPTGSSSGTSPAPSASSDATVTILVPDLGNLRFDPFGTSGTTPYGTALYATLVESDGHGGLAPGIATKWSVSPDGLTWTFTIRTDVTFQDGTPLTVDDVVYSLNDTYGATSIAQSTTTAIVSLAKNTVSITATGTDTFQVVHKTPVPSFPEILSSEDSNLGGAIFPKAYFERVGRDGFNQAPIGAGPFKVTSVKPGQSITMERYDGYYDKAKMPKFKTLVWDQVPEEATRVQALAAGQADIAQADFTQKQQIEQGGGSLVYQPESAYVRTSLAGCWNPQFPCHDIRVRQALDFALDKNLIMGQLYGDSWQDHGWAFVSPGSMGYSTDLDPRAPDPTMAKSLLAAAGFPNGQGFPTLTISTAQDATVPLLPEMAQLIAQQWHDVLGIPTEVKVLDAATLKADFNGQKLWGGVYLAANGARWDGGSIVNSGYGDVQSLTRNQEDPALLAQVKSTLAVTDPDARPGDFNTLYKTLKDQDYEIGTGSLSLTWGVGKRVTGWQPWSLVSRVTGFDTMQVAP